MEIDALHGQSVGGLGGRKLRFRPQLFWQEVLPEHAVSASLEVHFDLASGRNFARHPGGAAVAANGSYARSVAKAVADDEVAPDEARLASRALREAAQSCAADDVAALMHILCSCYCNRAALDEALCEASRLNCPAAVQLLLEGGACFG